MYIIDTHEHWIYQRTIYSDLAAALEQAERANDLSVHYFLHSVYELNKIKEN